MQTSIAFEKSCTFKTAEVPIKCILNWNQTNKTFTASRPQLIPDTLMGIFTQDEAVIQEGSSALRIISGGFIISSISVILSGALEGLGKGTESLVISLIRYIVLILPAAFGMSCIMGAAGVWHSFWITELVAAAISCFVYSGTVRNKE